MKHCPRCNSSYTDDNLQFCLQDGNPLVSYQNQEPETVVRQNPPVNQMRIDIAPPQTQTQPQFSQANYSQPQPPKKSNLLLIVLATIFGVFVLLGLGGLAGFLYFNQTKPTEVSQNTKINSSNSNTNSNVNSNANVNANTNANTNANLATPTPKPTLKPAEIATTKKDVENQIYGWKSASENHSLDANMNNYADTVDYYKGGKVPASKIRADKQKAYNSFDSINIEISNIKVVPDPSGEKVTATFDKDWDFSGAEKFSRGSVQQQLIFTKINGKWKITSEKELKVYFSDNGKNEDDF